MEALRQYFISITAAAILCSIITGILEKGSSSQKILKTICGLFLTFTVIRPIAHIQLEDLSFFTSYVSADAQAAISSGQSYMRDSMASLIKEETEAYILDKAHALNSALKVEVIVSSSSQPVPIEVYLTGDILPAAKHKLQKIIEDDLCISRENQIWIR